MRFPDARELKNDWQRQWAWADDRKFFFNTHRRKTSVYAYHLRFRTLLGLVREYVPPGGRVLEMGPAQCNYALTLAEEGFAVTAVDLQQDFLDYARLKHEKGDIEFTQGNFMEFCRPGAYDGVLCGEIIEHVAFPRDLLKAANRNLKPGGILVLSTPNGGEEGSLYPTFSQVKDPEDYIPRQFHWGNHTFLYTRDELRSLGEECGLETVSCSGINSRWQNRLLGLRYLLPMAWVDALETSGRGRKRHGREITKTLVQVYRKVRET